MARLTDFDAEMVDVGDRKGVGVLFRCTTGHCRMFNLVLFANPIDGGPPIPGSSDVFLMELVKVAKSLQPGADGRRPLCRGCGTFRWNRDPNTTTLETLTLTPSVDMHQCGHFYVTNGGW